MSIFPFSGKEKNKDLDEIKRLTMGQENTKQPSAQTPKFPFEEKKPFTSKSTQSKVDLAAFKEEQKIFTQVTSVKELNSEPNYGTPKELNKSKENSDSNITKKDSTQTSTSASSSFDKLLNLKSSNITTDKKKETLSSTDFGKQSITPEKIVQQENSNEGAISMQSSLNAKPVVLSANQKQEPLIQKPIEVNSTKETKDKDSFLSQKEEHYSWMDEPIIEEPITQDFEAEEESAFSKQKRNAEEQKRIENKINSLKTPVDKIFELLEKYKKIDTGEIANYLQIDPLIVEKISKMFESDGVVEIEYPTSLTKKPILILKNPTPSKLTKIPVGKVLETYQIEVDYVPAQISIVLDPEEARPIYALEMPSIGKYTKRFLEFIKDEVAENMPIEIEEIVDPKKSKKLKERFFFELNSHLSKYFPEAPKDLLNMLSGVLLHEMYGLGDIEIIMGDDMLEEVGINSAKTPITVYHRIHGWLKTNLMPGTEEDINNFSSQIGRKIGREITNLSPILDAHLLSGDRVNATLFPISSEGNTITIRRFARKPWTIVDFIGKAHTMNSEMAAMLWLAMQYEMNILIAGGTASGKTSALNSMLALVPTYHRILSIEDVREIILPKYLDWNWIPMVTRSPNPEGLGEVTMLDLMVTSLRMRPDRIIVGEIRRKKEAEVLMEAIETGHSIYSTLHANSGYQVLRRLAEPPINIPLMQIELIDLIVVQYRDRKTNKRRTYEISEIEQTSSGQGLQINTVYKWLPRTDSWEKLNKPTKLITLLNMHTGMTEDDINREIAERKEILEWLKRIDLNDLDDIGYIVKMFYSYPEQIKKLAKKNTPIEEIRKMMQGEKDDASAMQTVNQQNAANKENFSM
ncbi:MAG: type II/IV secretion system ATPase subunit [archaeon]|jgi:flagellar protein FlaI